jgi:hypothetical protein
LDFADLSVALFATAKAPTIRPCQRIADGYAADLLMPNYLFRPLAKKQSKLSFRTVSDLAETFKTSLTSTAIRLVEGDHSPSLLVCHGLHGRKWFTRAPSVPPRWFPQETLDAKSFAMSVLFGGTADNAFPRKIGAESWFDRRDADRYEVMEQTLRIGSNETRTLLLIADQEMLQGGALM